MNRVFRSSVIRGGGIIKPETIAINNESVIWAKRTNTLINKERIVIPINRISSVNILPEKLIGTTIHIYSGMYGNIVATKFSLKDARTIKEILDSMRWNR